MAGAGVAVVTEREVVGEAEEVVSNGVEAVIFPEGVVTISSCLHCERWINNGT